MAAGGATDTVIIALAYNIDLLYTAAGCALAYL